MCIRALRYPYVYVYHFTNLRARRYLYVYVYAAAAATAPTNFPIFFCIDHVQIPLTSIVMLLEFGIP